MKKYLFIAICIVLSTLTAIAETTIAVFPFTGVTRAQGNMLADIMGGELHELADYQIAPRTTAINRALNEQEVQKLGFTDTDTIAQLGKGANANFVVSGHVQKLGKIKLISVSIINVATLQQIGGDYIEYNKIDNAIEEMNVLATSLINKIKQSSNKKNLPTLAIVPFETDKSSNAYESEAMAHILAIRIANSGKYAVVSRTSAMDSAMKELDIQASGLTDADTAAILGKAINANYVLAGSISQFSSSSIYMNASIINVERITLEKSATENYSKSGYVALSTLENISYKLTGEKELGGLITEEAVIAKGNAIEQEKVENAAIAREDRGYEIGASLFVSYSPYTITYPDSSSEMYHAVFTGLKLEYIVWNSFSTYVASAVDTIGLSNDYFMLDNRLGARFVPLIDIGNNQKFTILPLLDVYLAIDYLKTSYVEHLDVGIGIMTGLEFRFNNFVGVGLQGGYRFFFNGSDEVRHAEQKSGVDLSNYEIALFLSLYL